MCAQQTSARILVVGDAGVGKSSLIHLICSNEVLASPQPTVGCRISVKVRQRSPSGKLQFVEFFEVGGNTKYRREARCPFYSNFNAIIFVYDVTDESTLGSLWQWNKEIQEHMESKGAIADNPYASISQRRGLQGSGRSESSKGPRHRATTQCFEVGERRRTSYENTGATSSSPTSNGSSDFCSSPEDDSLHPAQGLTMPPVLIVGTKADLLAPTHSVNPCASWQRDLMQLGAIVLRRAAQVMRRVLFLPAPVKTLLHIGGSSLNGDKAGPVKAADMLAYLHREWNAAALDLSCQALQEDKLHKIELFTDRVMDSVFSFNCKV